MIQSHYPQTHIREKHGTMGVLSTKANSTLPMDILPYLVGKRQQMELAIQMKT